MDNFVPSIMKKLIVFILAFLYITSSCEATVYLHYCMGKPISISLLPEKSGNCRKCGMKKSGRGMGCCKDEQKMVKSDKNQKITDLGFSTNQQIKFIAVPGFFRTYTPGYLQPTVNRQPFRGPPESKTVPVYLINCLFLI
jgi:hypothetical protein